jgi:hypothetical protein
VILLLNVPEEGKNFGVVLIIQNVIGPVGKIQVEKVKNIIYAA